jgi:Asp-tRNA(Asn)/Glu-tRNA(Gln) amidotransferase A subunit family amidase
MDRRGTPSGVTTIEGELAPEELEALLSAFGGYEAALMTNDLDALDRYFASGPSTMRGDASGLLVGHERISAFRGLRGGVAPRTISEIHVRVIDDSSALIVSVSAFTKGGAVLQTQLWRSGPSGWVISAAHVTGAPPALNGSVWRVAGAPLVPPLPGAPALPGDGRDSRPLALPGDGGDSHPLALPGDGGDSHPLALPGDGGDSRPLGGMTVAVKDLYDVAGFAVGAGIPEFLAEASVAAEDADAVGALRAAGAAVQGIAQTDEFAYSIAGRNVHYGTPPNPAVAGAIPGGSSSGPAAAVSLGQATIGLATDTAGSIRVPASYQGLWGMRTTHGSVSTRGLLPLAPSFDTVGWLARSAAALRAAAAVTFASAPGPFAVLPEVGEVRNDAVGEPAVWVTGTAAGTAPGARGGGEVHGTAGGDEVHGTAGGGEVHDTSGGGAIPMPWTNEGSSRARFVVSRDLVSSCADDVQAAFDGVLAEPVFGGVEAVELGDLDAVFAAFRTVQAAEAWRVHGEWITAHPSVLGADIAERFELASRITREEETDARAHLAHARARFDAVLAGRILLLPSASSAAPALDASADAIGTVRAATLRMTAVAGTGGYPAVSAPLLRVPAPGGTAPVGLCFVGPRGSDLALIDLAASVAEALGA